MPRPPALPRRRLLTGPAGCGKTWRALELVRDAATLPGARGRHARPGSDALLVLPTYAQALHLKRVALSRWDARALLDEVFTTFTAAGERFVPGFRVRALPSAEERDRLMEEALRRARVELFSRVADRPGFRSRLLRLAKEVKQSGLPPERAADRLARAADRLDVGARERLEGFLATFRAYQGLLDDADLEDHEDVLRALLERLRAGPPADLPSLLVLDGFDDLTPVEEAILVALDEAAAASGAAIVVTLPADPARPDLFAASAGLRQRLLARGFVEERLEGFPRATAPGLVRLAASLFGPPPEAPVEDDAVGLLVAGDDEDEAEAVARLARRLHDEGALRGWRDLGVVVRRTDDAGPRLEAAMGRLGVPVRVHGGGTPLAAAPLVRALRGPLRVLAGHGAAGDLEPEALVAWLRWSAHAAGDAALSDAVDADEVRWRRTGWPPDLARLEAGASPPVQAALASLGALAAPLATCRGTAPVAAALADLLPQVAPLPPEGGLDADGRPLDPAADRRLALAAAARARLLDLLRGLEAAARRTGLGTEDGAREVVASWLEAVDHARLVLPDRRLDVVNVVDAEEARSWELPVVVVAGLSEGSFPLRPREDVLLRDDEREALGERDGAGDGLALPLAAEQEARERRLFYGAVTRARRRLLLVRSGVDEGGEARGPSLFLRDLQRVVRPVALGPDRPPGAAAPPLAGCHDRLDLALFAAAHARDRRAPPAVRALARALLAHGDGDLGRRAARWRRRRADPLEGAGLDPADLAARFAASVARVSASRVNDALACRHRHFLRRVVRLPEDDAPLAGPSVDARDHGRLVHAAFRLALVEPERPAEAVADRVLAEAGPDLEGAELDLLRRDLARSVLLLRDREARAAGPFRAVPAELERAFGAADEVVLRAGGDVVHLEGRLDRLDVAGRDAIVVDYKLSPSSVDHAERAFREGLDVQLPLYALAVEATRGLRVVGLEWMAARVRRRRTHVDAALADRVACRREGVAAKEHDAEDLRALLAGVGERTVEVVRRVRDGDHQKQDEDPERCEGCPVRSVCRPFHGLEEEAVP